MERIIESFQRAYCPRFNESRENYIVIREFIAIGNNKHYGFEQFKCPNQPDCKHSDHRGFCPFVKEVLDRFIRG